jgi:pyruvate formate lyase activating enzyme
MKEAILYKKLKDKKVECQLCSHRCKIADGKKGICAVRENKDGVLYSLAYGKAIAAHIDPIEKKPLFHFLPGSKSFSIATAGCNFRCEFCQNWDISQLSKEWRGEFPGEDLSPERIVSEAVRTRCQSIAYTYTEPTIFFEYAYDTAKLAQRKGLKNAFVTNGFQTPEAIKKMVGVIDAANIDLKSFSDEFYVKICGGRLRPVLEAIKLMWEKKIWVEVTTLVVPNQNDSERELTQIAKFLAGISKDIPWHVSRFQPQYKMTDRGPTPIETLRKAVRIGKRAGLNYIYVGNVLGDPNEHTYCPKCGKTVIKRLGYQVQNFLKKDRCPSCNFKIPIVIE